MTHDPTPDLPLRAIPVLDLAGHEPAVLLAPRRDPFGATVEIDVDGRGVQVRLADLIDVVATVAADVAVGVWA